MELYAKYEGAVAADRGVVAFIKWFLISLILHGLAIIPGIACLIAAVMSKGDAVRTVAIVLFFLNVLGVRVFLFALPCERAARTKGYGPRYLWGAAGFMFAPFALGLAAALPPRGAAAPNAAAAPPAA